MKKKKNNKKKKYEERDQKGRRIFDDMFSHRFPLIHTASTMPLSLKPILYVDKSRSQEYVVRRWNNIIWLLVPHTALRIYNKIHISFS